jgi:hypothetical protein
VYSGRRPVGVRQGGEEGSHRESYLLSIVKLVVIYDSQQHGYALSYCLFRLGLNSVSGLVSVSLVLKSSVHGTVSSVPVKISLSNALEKITLIQSIFKNQLF